MAKTTRYHLGFDFETGGLSPDSSDALTLYLGLMDDQYKIVEELDLKLKPEDRNPMAEASALAVNGINIADHLADPATITYSEAKKAITEMLKKYSKKIGRGRNIKALGKNVPFDLGFMHKYLLTKEEWLDLVHYKYTDVDSDVDLLKEAGYFPDELGTLTTVCEYLNVPLNDAHTAKADTLATVECHKKVIEILKSKKDGAAPVDLISLLEAE